jgi:hypothetical protein
MRNDEPYIPLPETEPEADCICGRGRTYESCCGPRLERLNTVAGSLEETRDLEGYSSVFQAYSDLLWEEQFRDEEQGRMAQEYDEWDEWASYLWLEGVILDGFTIENRRPLSDLLYERLLRDEDYPGGRQTLRALLRSYEGIYEIAPPLPADGPGCVRLKLVPFEQISVRVPRIFLPPDTAVTDMIIGRFVRLGGIDYPTHQPLVIPMLPDGSNFDAAYRILAATFPTDLEGPMAVEMMIRQFRARGDLLLRVALEALLPLEEESLLEGQPMVADGGEIRYMVSDFAAVESHLDTSPFFDVIDPLIFNPALEAVAELLEEEELPPRPIGPGWRLQLEPETRRRLRPVEREQVENLIRKLAQRIRPPSAADAFEHWASDPGLTVHLDAEAGTLTLRAFLAQPLELGRFMLEREVGPFLARESEEYLIP